MGFLAPWFLAAGALVGLPLYLHLLRRDESTPRPFSSLIFFERRQQASIRHRRLRYLLLLSLRLALVALIVLAFANPFINRTAPPENPDKLTLLVVDNSVTMRAGSRLADAKREAARVLAAHKASDRVQIATLGGGLHLLTRPNDDPATHAAALASIDAGDSRGNFGELGRAVRVLADSLGAPLELHLFSDLQRSKMPATFGDVAFPSNVNLVLHAVADGPAEPNWTVESVNAPGQIWAQPRAEPKGGSEAAGAGGVDAVIAGYATPASTKTVTLAVNGKTLSTRSVQIPPSGRATVHFPSLDVPYGFSRCEVRIDAGDALAADDVYRFAVDRSEPPKALLVHTASDTRSILYLTNAAAAVAQSAVILQPITIDQLSSVRLTDYAFVILSNVASLTPAVESGLVKYVQGGGNILIAVGTAAVGRARIPVFGELIQDAHNYGSDLAQGHERFVTVGDIDRSHPAVAKTGSWSDVRFFYVVRLGQTDARTIVKLTDQTPLLLEKRMGGGHVLLFTSGFDNVTNDLPVHAAFVPFLQESAQYLAGVQRTGGAQVVDSFVELRGTPDGRGAGSAPDRGVEVIDPNGRRPLSLTEAAAAQSFRLTEAGFYQLRLSDGRQDLIGVNPDRRAANLEVLPDEVRALWQGDGASRPTAGPRPNPASENVKKPLNLWWYVVLVALGAALWESFVASRYLGVQAEES